MNSGIIIVRLTQIVVQDFVTWVPIKTGEKDSVNYWIKVFGKFCHEQFPEISVGVFTKRKENANLCRSNPVSISSIQLFRISFLSNR